MLPAHFPTQAFLGGRESQCQGQQLLDAPFGGDTNTPLLPVCPDRVVAARAEAPQLIISLLLLAKSKFFL